MMFWKKSRGYEVLDRLLAQSSKAIDERTEEDERQKRAFPVGTRFFFQTSIYSYVGVIAEVTHEWIRLEDAAIVKLRDPIFEVMDRLGDLLLPIKGFVLRRSYIASHFEWEPMPKLAQVKELKDE
jgi:hypothetical protein